MSQPCYYGYMQTLLVFERIVIRQEGTSQEQIGTISNKLGWFDPWMAPFQICLTVHLSWLPFLKIEFYEIVRNLQFIVKNCGFMIKAFFSFVFFVLFFFWQKKKNEFCCPDRYLYFNTFLSGFYNRFFWLTLVFNATFSNISAISWRPVLVVEETGVPGENHQPWASNW